ncbi:unnamed protein product [Pedinophyceae sp. YPF-701]|nr:unnamed protein product [Pedinophyceae sp. YPF-701]
MTRGPVCLHRGTGGIQMAQKWAASSAYRARRSGGPLAPTHRYLGRRSPAVRQTLSVRMRRNAVGTDSEPQASPDALERLLLWARANGVKGVGGAGDKLALFETDDGDRGLVATEDISYGEVVLQVPLRIAITDHDAPEPYEGAPWSVRLACRILRERGDPSSPFKPYIDSLPSVVPGPVTTWSWDDVQSIQYPPVLNEIYETNFLIMDAFRNVGSSPDPVLSSIEFDDFMWAMSCVHSRTFGLPAKTGPGIGVRVMVPVVDMLNHAAAELDVMPSANWRAKDNLRWEVRSPERSDSDEWMFVVECIRPCAAQEEIFLSYGQRASDDFLVHYGFFPDSNANEATLLFESLEDAVTWAAENAPRVSEVQTAEDTPALLSRARTAAGAVQKALAKEGGDVPDKIDLQTRARMDYRAVVAFAAAVDTSWDIRVNPQEDWAWSGVLDVPPAAQAAASELGALRAIEVLEGMPSTLVEDLQVLAKAEQEQVDKGS